MSYPALIIHPVLLQMCQDLLIVPAHMLRIPPIAPSKTQRKGGMLPLQGHIPTAHDALSQVVEAVAEMPPSLLWHPLELTRSVSRYNLDNRVEAVELVGHRGRECRGGIGLEWRGEVVVVLCVVDLNVAQTS